MIPLISRVVRFAFQVSFNIVPFPHGYLILEEVLYGSQLLCNFLIDFGGEVYFHLFRLFPEAIYILNPCAYHAVARAKFFCLLKVYTTKMGVRK